MTKAKESEPSRDWNKAVLTNSLSRGTSPIRFSRCKMVSLPGSGVPRNHFRTRHAIPTTSSAITMGIST